MRKLIDIPDKLVPELAKIAATDKTNPKNWIEKLVENEIKKRIKNENNKPTKTIS